MKNVWFSALAGALLLAGCNSGGGTTASSDTATTTGTTGSTSGSSAGGDKVIAFVTNNASDYWILARKGTEKAASELKGFKVQFVMNPSTDAAASQKQKLQDLVSDGVKGIAVSPVDPENQTPDLNAVAAKTLLITQDSDAPKSDRVCYIGTDNVAAGKMAADAVKKALPQGGKIMVFVGKADAQNAKERFDGLKQELAGSNVTIVAERTDDGDRARAKQNVSDAIIDKDIVGCVGLWSYNGPAIYNAVKEANKGGKVQIVCFDSEPDTVRGLQDGTIAATVIQQPFEFGYQSMMLMAKYINGDKTAFPATKQIIVPTTILDKASLPDFLSKQK
jgi:ribose transport system substrate-binding protein